MPFVPERGDPCHPRGVMRDSSGCAEDWASSPSHEGVPMADQASDTPVLDLLTRMTADSMVSAGLDPQSLMVARIAALVAVGAPTASYLTNLAAADAADLDPEQVRGVLAAVAPIVGTARVVDAAGN